MENKKRIFPSVGPPPAVYSQLGEERAAAAAAGVRTLKVVGGRIGTEQESVDRNRKPAKHLV